MSLDIQANCGTGDGGFKPGNRCAKGGGGGSGGGSGGGGGGASGDSGKPSAKNQKSLLRRGAEFYVKFQVGRVALGMGARAFLKSKTGQRWKAKQKANFRKFMREGSPKLRSFAAWLRKQGANARKFRESFMKPRKRRGEGGVFDVDFQVGPARKKITQK